MCRYFPFCCCLLLLFTACQKDTSTEVPGSSLALGSMPAGGNMKAAIEGTGWVANKHTTAARYLGRLIIKGMGADKKMLVLSLQDSGVHRYTLEPNSRSNAVLIDSTESDPLPFGTNQGNRGGGEVSITALNTSTRTVSGRFSFTLYRAADGKTQTVSEGSFNDIPYLASMPVPGATDTVSLRVNGAPWYPDGVTAVSLGGSLMVTANKAAGGQTLGLEMPADIKPGEYLFELFGNYTATFKPTPHPGQARTATSGKLTIVEHNTGAKRLRGSFAFRGAELTNASQTVTVEDGFFSVKYQ